MKMRNSRIFKIIAFALVQAFLLLDVSWAGADIMRSSADTSTLAPSVNLNKTDVQNGFLAEEGEDIDDLDGMIGYDESTDDLEEQATNANSSIGAPIIPQGTSAGLQPTDVSGASNPNLLVPPPDANNITHQFVAMVPFRFVPLWKRKDLEEYFRRNYGIEFVSEGISRKELRQFYKAFHVAYATDPEFRNHIFQSEHWQVEILGDSLYFDESSGKFISDRAVWPSYDPDKDISKISLYKPFFYKYKFDWFSITRDVVYQQTELCWVVKQVIGTKLLYLEDKDAFMLSGLDFTAANTKDKLAEFNLTEERLTLNWLRETILADRNPARGWMGHRDVLVTPPEFIKVNVFNVAFSLSSIKSDRLSPQQKVNLYHTLNRVARETKVTRVTSPFLDEVLKRTNISLSENKKDNLMHQLNWALDQSRDEEDYWAVKQKTWPDGKKGSLFTLYIPAVKKLHRLALGCQQYSTAPIRKWKINEADSAMTLFELIFARAEMSHEREHAINIPVKDENNPVLPIPIGAAARKTTQWLFNLAAGNFRKAYGLFSIPRGRIPAHVAIRKTLEAQGHNPYTEGPVPFPGIMKEVHASAGVFQESGLLGIAAGLWFFYVFEADDTAMYTLNYQIDHVLKTRYTFLNAKTRNLVKQYMQMIDQDYRKDNKLANRELGFVREDESIDDGYSLRNLDKWLALIAVLAIFLVACTGQQSGASGVTEFFTSAVFNATLLFFVAGVVTANIIMSRRTTRSRTIRLVNRASKKNDYSGLYEFYRESGYGDKEIIIDTLVTEVLNNGKINKEDLETIFTMALEVNAEEVLGGVYDKLVVSGLQLGSVAAGDNTVLLKVISAVGKEVEKLKLDIDPEKVADEIWTSMLIDSLRQQTEIEIGDKDAFLKAVNAETKKELDAAIQGLRHKAAGAIRKLTETRYAGSQRLIVTIEKYIGDGDEVVQENIIEALGNLGVSIIEQPLRLQLMKREPDRPQIPSSESPGNRQIAGPEEDATKMLETRTVRHKVDPALPIEKKEIGQQGQVVTCETSI